MRTRTAVVLDSLPLWLEGIENVLRKIGVHVIGKATSAERALAIVEEQHPSLLITAMRMGDGAMDGIECLRRARDRVPGLKTVVLSLSEDPNDIDAAFEAGADAYVLKNVHPDDLASVIRQAFQHSVYLPRPHHPSAPLQRAPAERPRADDGANLTRREREILELVAEGRSNAELARSLWVTEQTVKFHLSNIYRKLGVANRTEASRWAQVHGLLPASRRSAVAA